METWKKKSKWKRNKRNWIIFIFNKIDFSYKYKFIKEEQYAINFLFKQLLTNTNYLFYECNKLLSVDLSNFNIFNVTSMEDMFSECYSLNISNLILLMLQIWNICSLE